MSINLLEFISNEMAVLVRKFDDDSHEILIWFNGEWRAI